MTREWITKGVEPMLLEQMKNGLPASELWSLLLEVIERRTAARSLSSVTQQWRSDRFVVPSYVDQRTALEIDRQLFAAADAFEAIELSPLAPLGACSLVAPTSQNRVVSTVRGTEVVSDPTNILALESTHRLRVDSTRRSSS